MFCHRKITIGKFSCAFCMKSNNSMKYWLLSLRRKNNQKLCGLINEQESNSLISWLTVSKTKRESYSLVHYPTPNKKKTIVVVVKQKQNPSIKVRATVPNQKKQKKYIQNEFTWEDHDLSSEPLISEILTQTQKHVRFSSLLIKHILEIMLV